MLVLTPNIALFSQRRMPAPVLLLRLLLFALIVRAKHDGQIPDDDGGDDDHSSSSPATTAASPPPPQTTSTILATSTLTTNPSASSPTSSSSSASAVPSGALQFTPPGNMTTCSPALFTWEFNSNTSVPLTIVVTNERAVSSQIPAPNQSAPPLVERTLSTTVDARTCVISWSQVNVPEGTYTLLASDTAHSGVVSAQSFQFFVSQGSDTSCLSQNSTTSANGPSSSDSGASDDTTDPQSPSGGPKSMSIGAIVGTIAGILVGVGGLLLVFSLPRLRRRILRSKPPQRPGGPYMLF